jgi:spermidine synthase
VVKRYWQSGKYAERIMREGLENIKLDFSKVKKILILGLACGSMIEVINKSVTDCEITGVDMDGVMVDIGKKYFNINNYQNLKIIISDAFNFLIKLRKKEKYNLVISDLFIGCDTKSKLQTDEFLQLIYEHLTDKGVYISNTSYNLSHRKQSDIFLDRVKKNFDFVDEVIKHQNLIIRAYKV